jgi:zinc transporter ZupT
MGYYRWLMATVSWRRALLHASLTFIVAVVLGGIAVALLQTPGSNARVLGRAAGRLGMVAAAAAFAVSALRQSGRHKAALGVAIGFLVLLGMAAMAAR